MTSSSSFVRNVIAVPCLPARPVRPKGQVDRRQLSCRRERRQVRTDTMHIGFDSVGHLVIDDQTDVLDIDTTTSEVGRDEDVRVACP